VRARQPRAGHEAAHGERAPWTIDDPERMRTLLDLGVAGIITNVPDVLRALVDARGSDRPRR
jgi:glycerophosphoryl diester phosphodiesterase